MSKKRTPAKSQIRRQAGIYPAAQPVPHRWKVDYDYLSALSSDEKAWLGDFSDAHYSGDFRSDLGKASWSPVERRAVYSARNVGWTDSYARAAGAEALDWLDSRPPRGEEAGPEHDGEPVRHPDMSYLDTPEYRTALAEYRETLNPGRAGGSPKNPQHPEALAKFRSAVRAIQMELGEKRGATNETI